MPSPDDQGHHHAPHTRSAPGPLRARCPLQQRNIQPRLGRRHHASPTAQPLERPGRKPRPSHRGKLLFNTRHGGEWSCASCHGTPPTTQGKHASTGKSIAPLAPAFNPKAFTDTAKVDKWFRRNCNDVLSRECTAIEKADVLAYLNALKP